MTDVPIGLARSLLDTYGVSREALNDTARATLDQAQAYVRDFFDSIDASLTDPAVAYHAIAALAVVVECARHAARSDEIDGATAVEIAALTRIVITAFAAYLPDGARR